MQLTHPCDIESRRTTPERRASWHKDCPYPQSCECPAHNGEVRKSGRDVRLARWDKPRTTKGSGL